MLEHRSTPDPMMSIRIMGYTALLYEDLVMRSQSKPPHKLPAILPIVLYSGPNRWRAPLQVSDLLDTAPDGLLAYQPNMRYLILDEGLLVKKGQLPEENLAALLFRLEHNRGLEPSVKMMQTVLRLTQGSEFSELRKAFFLWVRHVLLPRSLPDTTEFSKATDLSEITTMLTTHKDWGYYFRKEGEQKGRLEGRKEGRRQGTSSTLSTLIAHKFGPLPEWVQSRLEEATETELNRWTLRVLDAQRIEEIFA